MFVCPSCRCQSPCTRRTVKHVDRLGDKNTQRENKRCETAPRCSSVCHALESVEPNMLNNKKKIA